MPIDVLGESGSNAQPVIWTVPSPPLTASRLNLGCWFEAGYWGSPNPIIIVDDLTLLDVGLNVDKLYVNYICLFDYLFISS